MRNITIKLGYANAKVSATVMGVVRVVRVSSRRVGVAVIRGRGYRTSPVLLEEIISMWQTCPNIRSSVQEVLRSIVQYYRPVALLQPNCVGMVSLVM